MRAVIQRVAHARVEIEGKTSGAIDQGLLLLLGITHDDNQADIDWLIRKLIQLRIFNDEAGKMNLSVQDIQGGILVVSQFTLYADSKKGNRPSYTRSAHPDIAIPLYEEFLATLRRQFSGPVETGEFGAMMAVSLLNDGPVTILWIPTNPDFKKVVKPIPSLSHSLIQSLPLSMTLTEAQQTVDRWIQEYGVRYFSELTNTAILMEEVGEVARIMSRKYGDQSFKKSDEAVDLADEMADVLFVLICLANQTGIDLEAALQRNLEKKTKRDAERHKNNEKLGGK